MKRVILTFLIFGCISSLTFAQSQYLERGQSGFGLNGGFSSNENLSGFSAQVGYSISGVFDVGISGSRFGFEQQLLGEELNATVISPFVSYLVIKQDESRPLSVSLNGAYQREIYTNDVLSNNNIDMTGNNFTFGVSLFSDFQASEAITIQPEIGASYITGETEATDSSGIILSSSVSTAVYNFGLSLIFESSSNNDFVVSPALSIQDEITTFGLSLSYIIPQN